MKRHIVMFLGMFGLGMVVAHAQTLNESWENTPDGWTILLPNFTSTGFSTTAGVTAGTYSWNLTAQSGPSYNNALQGPSSTALTALLADAAEVTLDIAVPTNGDFGYFLQWDMAVNQPGGLGSMSTDGGGYSQSANIGGSKTMTFTILSAIRSGLAANPTLPTYITFAIGGGSNSGAGRAGTFFLDNLRVWELPTYTESWENTPDGWTILVTNWTSTAFSTNGATLGTDSWELTAKSSPGYVNTLQSPSSTALTAALSFPGSVDLDIDVPTNGSFGYFLQWDLSVSQPGGLGTASIDGGSYAQSANIGGTKTMVFPISSAITTALAANPTLPASLIFAIGGGSNSAGPNAGTIFIDNLRVTPNSPPVAAPAQLWVRETWDDDVSELYPAITSVTNDVSSVGFSPTAPWVTNPSESNNNCLLAIRDFFPEPDTMGLPSTLDGTTVALVEDNSFDGRAGHLWTAGDYMTRQLTSSNFINFTAEGEYWFAMTIGQLYDAQYSGDISASGAGGIGFADGINSNADYVAIGVTGTNVYLGPTNASNPFGTTNVSKTLYISQGTLGQPGNTNSLAYNPINDPLYAGQTVNLTNFTGGPYFVSAYATNKIGQSQGDSIVVLGHLRTHANGTATLDARTYSEAAGDELDLTTNTIVWDCRLAFNFSGTMTKMLVFENGEFPFYIYAFRASTNYANIVGIDPGYIKVAPLANTYAGYPVNMTNFAAEAAPISSGALFNNGGYGTLNYQWYQNGLAISGATSQYFNIASAATTDASLPAGVDAGTYTCVATDPSGTWNSVTTAPVVITVTSLPPPQVSGVQLFGDGSTVQITLNEPNLTGAGLTNNYILNNGATVTNATVVNQSQSTLVQLQIGGLSQGTRVTLIVTNIANVVGELITNDNIETFWTEIPTTGTVSDDFWAANSSGANLTYYNSFLVSNPHPLILTNYALTRWDGPGSGVNVNGGNYFGGRMYGWFSPPITGNYVFYVACDDGGRLSLSTNADPTNLCVIAAESLWSNGDSWTNYSYEFPTGDHRGDGTSTTADPTGTFAWDTSAASLSAATACQQNRSDQFIVAYYDSSGLTGGPAGATDPWSEPPALSQVTDVVLPGSRFWPKLDANGDALITLTAGQKYFMQLEHVNQTGGYAESVTYKLAGTADPVSPTASLLSGTNISALAPFTPSISIAETHTGPVITYSGVLLSGTNPQTINTPVAGQISSGGPAQYTPPTGAAAMFYRAGE